jgi:hypothetical protein
MQNKQYEFEMINKRTGRLEHARATAHTHDAARKAIVDYYGDQFDIMGFCCDVNAPHAVLGEIDCTI